MRQIKDFITAKAITVGGTLELFFPVDAIKFIEKCVEQDIQIYGLDAFKLDGNGIQPFLEFSADYSNIKKENSWDLAKKHLETKTNKEFLFEIVYEDIS